MAMGRRKRARQQSLWVASANLERAPGHPFYRKLNGLLERHGFDEFVEELCRPHYAERVGRPSVPPGVFFRMLFVGYFEGIGSERGIAWRVADSMSLREFIGFELSQSTPDHSTISGTRRMLPKEVYDAVFAKVLEIVAKAGLLRASTIGVDATTLEANAAMRSIVRRDSGAKYEEFVTELARAEGIENPTREDLARVDRKRKKKGSNDDWKHPHDPDARITKMKDGRTHLAHKAEHAVDMETGAVIAVTVQPADRGDTSSLAVTLDAVDAVLDQLLENEEVWPQLPKPLVAELVADKGYHSNAVLKTAREDGLRTYISEPKRGRRRWEGKAAEQQAVYANRRRMSGERGRGLARKRGEMVERPMAHAYETGGMRRTHVRGHRNIEKRLLAQHAALNLGLVMRALYRHGTPRGAHGLLRALSELFSGLRGALEAANATIGAAIGTLSRIFATPPHAALVGA